MVKSLAKGLILYLVICMSAFIVLISKKKFNSPLEFTLAICVLYSMHCVTSQTVLGYVRLMGI